MFETFVVIGNATGICHLKIKQTYVKLIQTS